MATIALDICNTLADINQVLQEALGPNPNPSNYYHPKVTKEFFTENLWVFETAKAIPGAVEIVNELATRHNIIYLTARPKEARAVTKKWLVQNGFPSAPVIMSTQKAEVAKRLGIALAIDDAPHEISSLKTVTNVLIHAQPYNIGMGQCFAWHDSNLLAEIERLTASKERILKPKVCLAY